MQQRLPLKVISEARSPVFINRLTVCVRAAKIERQIAIMKSHTEADRAGKHGRNKQEKNRPTSVEHMRGDGRLSARLQQPHPSDAARFFKGDSPSSTEGIPI